MVGTSAWLRVCFSGVGVRFWWIFFTGAVRIMGVAFLGTGGCNFCTFSIFQVARKFGRVFLAAVDMGRLIGSGKR